MGDYSGDLKVVKGVNIANLVLSVIFTVAMAACLGMMLASWSSLSEAALQSAYGSGSYELNVPDGQNADGFHHSGTTTAFQVTNAWGDNKSFDDSLEDSIEGDIDSELDEMLRDSNVGNSDIVAGLAMGIVAAFFVFGTLVGIFMLITSIMALRDCKTMKHLKRDFVMSIIAAALALFTLNLANLALFVLSAVFIQKARVKAGLTGSAKTPVTPDSTPRM